MTADRLKCDPASIWFNIESSWSKCPLWNLLHVNNLESVEGLCTNLFTLSLEVHLLFRGLCSINIILLF